MYRVCMQGLRKCTCSGQKSNRALLLYVGMNGMTRNVHSHRSNRARFLYFGMYVMSQNVDMLRTYAVEPYCCMLVCMERLGVCTALG